jgi:hypothetical protein
MSNGKKNDNVSADSGEVRSNADQYYRVEEETSVSFQKPRICLNCRFENPECEQSYKKSEFSFSVCPYGVAWINNNGCVERKEAPLNFQTIARNIRHNIGPLIAFIQNETIKLDKQIRFSEIKTDETAGRIAGATVAINHFIRVLAGIMDLHPIWTDQKTNHEQDIYSAIDKYYMIFSMFESRNRPKNLKKEIQISRNIFVNDDHQIFDSIFAVLSDNIWKHSINKSVFKVTSTVATAGEDYINLVFTNRSSAIPEQICDNIFDMGSKGNNSHDSFGFGFGLHWAKLIVDYYNIKKFEKAAPVTNPDEMNKYRKTELALVHKQKPIDDDLCTQEFVILNLPIYKM